MSTLILLLAAAVVFFLLLRPARAESKPRRERAAGGSRSLAREFTSPVAPDAGNTELGWPDLSTAQSEPPMPYQDSDPPAAGANHHEHHHTAPAVDFPTHHDPGHSAGDGGGHTHDHGYAAPDSTNWGGSADFGGHHHH